MHFTTAVIIKEANLYANETDTLMSVLSPAFDYHYLDYFDVETVYTVAYVKGHLSEIEDMIDAYAEDGIWQEGKICRQDMLDAFKEAIYECDLQDRVYLVNCHK